MHVLHVEDDPINRRVMKAMLAASGATVTEAFDGQEGVNAVERQAFDLVLMDLRMPGMDGISAIKAIRARSDERASVPIIVVTADTGPGLRETCLEIGADEVLSKPIAVKILYAAIAKVLVPRPAQ